MGAVLIVMGGLPGTGKSAAARHLAERIGGVWLRIDTIEQALRTAMALGEDVGEAGYAVGYALARLHLELGRAVIADCVNPLALTRAAWREVAHQAGAPAVEVELVCSDRSEHRRRIETRNAEIEGLVLPDWQTVVARRYEPWPEPHLVLDTATMTIEAAAAAIGRSVDSARPRSAS